MSKASTRSSPCHDPVMAETDNQYKEDSLLAHSRSTSHQLPSQDHGRLRPSGWQDSRSLEDTVGVIQWSSHQQSLLP